MVTGFHVAASFLFKTIFDAGYYFAYVSISAVDKNTLTEHCAGLESSAAAW